MNRFPVLSHVSPAILRVARFLNAVSALLIISLVMQVVGCVSPWWLYMTYEDTSVVMGLWYFVDCPQGVCECKPLFGAYSYVQKSFHLDQYRGETVSAILFCFVAAIVLRLGRNRLHNTSSQNVQVTLGVGGIFALVSGVLATVAAGKFGDFTRKMSDTMTSPGDYNVNFPYSLVSTGVGGLLALIACIVFLASQPWRISAESQPSQMQANHNASYPAQITTVHAGYDQPPMYAMSALTEKGQGAP